MVGVDHGPAEYVLDALEPADEPLSAGEIQRHIADEGLDATTGAIADTCDELVVTGDVEPVEDSPKQTVSHRRVITVVGTSRPTGGQLNEQVSD